MLEVPEIFEIFLKFSEIFKKGGWYE